MIQSRFMRALRLGVNSLLLHKLRSLPEDALCLVVMDCCHAGTRAV